jgi:hypothetical protein
MKYSLSFLFLCLSSAAFAQSSPFHCGSADYLNVLDNQYPGTRERVEHLTDHANYRSRSGTVTIPVVFHVVYNASVENLAVTYLNAQIDLLNQSYGRTNADTTNMRSIFQSRVGPSKIRFILDQVIRVSTTMTSFEASSTSGFANSDIVKQSGSGGSDAVSPDTKLNVWICDLTKDGSNTLIGYAYPPAGAPNWSSGSQAPSPAFDGVVIDYTDIGGPLKQPIGYGNGFRGKALVHEIGHYLGLRHIWGDDGGACQGQAGYKDDGLSDTPVSDDYSNFDCNKTKNTCVETSGDLLDMVENYMDYSSASCQNSFTKMQVSAMEYVLDNIRVNVRVPLGISATEEAAKKIELYPNPVSDMLYMDINNLDYASMNVAMTNTLGQVMLTISHKKSMTPLEINTRNFAKGIYFINVQIDDLPMISKKIILQ